MKQSTLNQIPVTTGGRRLFIELLTRKIKTFEYLNDKNKQRDIKLLEEAGGKIK